MKKYVLACGVILLTGFPVLQVEAASQKTEIVGRAYQSLENNPLAIVKEGLYVGIEQDRVSYIDERTGRKVSYRLEPDFKTIYQGLEIDWDELGLVRIPPHSVVKLVLIDGQVCEIILLEVSS